MSNVDPKVFWDNVGRLTYPKSIKEFAEEVSKKYSIAPRTIRNYSSEQRPPTFAQITAIAGVLKISLDTLVYGDVATAKGLEGYDDFEKEMEIKVKTYSKAYGLGIDYQIYKGNVTSFKITCSINYQLGDMYPESSSPSTGSLKDVYNVVNGNIYPSNCTPLEEEMLYTKRSIYECIDTFCKGGLDKAEYKSIMKMFAAYRKGRHSLGIIGKLSPYDFYMLNYEIGRLVKQCENLK